MVYPECADHTSRSTRGVPARTRIVSPVLCIASFHRFGVPPGLAPAGFVSFAPLFSLSGRQGSVDLGLIAIASSWVVRPLIGRRSVLGPGLDCGARWPLGWACWCVSTGWSRRVNRSELGGATRLQRLSLLQHPA